MVDCVAMASARIGSESGFTLVEVMVAIVVLLIGVLGAVTMIDGANAQTSRTKAREGGTALARTVLEVARGVPYTDLTSERVLAELQARGTGYSDADVTAPGHQVASRGFLYTVAPTVCSMDDPKDSLGGHDEVGVTFCADTDQMVGSPASVDRNPDDYRRVDVDLSWRAGTGPVDSTRQTGIVTNPVGGLGPTVTSLTQTSPSDLVTPVEILSGRFAEYEAITSTDAEDVAWSVKGNRMGSAEGADREWEFTWDLGEIDTPSFVDCTYVLQAQAFDDKARGGAPRALTVAVNRRKPFGPRGFAGGRNLRVGDDVDLQWDANLECDVQFYRVYRGVDGGAVDALVCEVRTGEETACVDESPPAGDLTYLVFAYDDDPDGVERVGDASPEAVHVPASADHGPPDSPATLTVCTGGSFAGECNDIEGNPAPAGTAVLSWPPVADPDGDGDPIRFYRVYRAGADRPAPTYADRLDVLFPVFDELGEPVSPLVFVDDTADGPHRYWVTAVDERFGESTPVGPVTWGAP
jgi:prepilin-type N-terminal cleavage/methylation domain-containing protein